MLDATTVEMHRLLKQSQGVSNKHSEQVIAVSHDMIITSLAKLELIWQKFKPQWVKLPG